MQQRDIIKDEIEQVGKVLGKIIADFFNLRSSDDPTYDCSITNKELKDRLRIDVDHILGLPDEDLEAYVLDRNISEDHLELLAKYFQELGISQTEPSVCNRYLRKAIAFLDIADSISNIKSFTRMMHKDELGKMMKNSEN